MQVDYDVHSLANIPHILEARIRNVK